MKIKEGFIVREVGGENIAVPIGERAKDFHGMISLNDTALFLWNFFKEDRTAEDAQAAVANEFDAPADLIKKDVENFIEELKTNGIME